MKKTDIVMYIKIVLFVVFATMIDCSQNTGITGGTTETTSAKLEGVIYNSDGSKAAGATVKLINAEANPFTAKNSKKILQATTDPEGAYSIAIDSNGLYNVCSQKSGMYSFTGSVHLSVQKNAEIDDTLKEPGSISGTALLSPRDDNTKIAIVVLGTNTYTLTEDTSGHFSIPILAEGEYVLRFMATSGDYMNFDTIVQVVSGKNTSLEHFVELSKYVVPTVESVSAEFDTNMMTVMVSWPKIDSSKVSGFTITRTCNGIDSQIVILGNQKQFYNDDVVLLNGDTVSYAVAAVGIDRSRSVPTASSKLKIEHTVAPDDSIQLYNEAEWFNSATVQNFKVDKNHNVYLSTLGWIVKFNASGSMVAEFVMDSMFYSEGWIGNIFSVDNNGNVYVSDTYRSKLYKLSPELKILKSIPAEKCTRLQSINNLSTDNNGHVYLSWWTGRVETYDTELNKIKVDTIPVRSAEPYVANNDTFYIQDQNRLSRCTIEGKFISSWEIEDKLFEYPITGHYNRRFFLLSTGEVIVTSLLLGRMVYKLDNSFKVIRKFYINGHPYNDCRYDGDDHLCYYDHTSQRVLFYKIP